MDKDTALRLALEVLESCWEIGMPNAWQKKEDAITAIKAALEAKDEPAPVAKNEGGRITWMIEDWPQNCLLYTHLPQQEAKYEPVAIKWEKDADKECRYNNWVGMTPFGRILITWKGWKEWHDACVDEFPGGFEAYGLPDDVKAACEVEYLRRLYTTPPQRKPLTELEAETLFDNCGGKWNGDHWVIKDADLHDFARAIEANLNIKGE